MKHHDILCAVTNKDRPEDYIPWGRVERWADNSKSYPDCSMGCRFAYWLEARDGEDLGADWCVCANPQSHASGC